MWLLCGPIVAHISMRGTPVAVMKSLFLLVEGLSDVTLGAGTNGGWKSSAYW